jgi:hypothetical protein
VAGLAVAAGAVAPSPADGPNRPGERYASVEWAPKGTPKPSARKLKLRWSGDGFACQYRLHRASARETRTTVTIKVLVHWRAMGDDEACILITAGGAATVKLDEPLGNRQLRHAPTNDPGQG